MPNKQEKATMLLENINTLLSNESSVELTHTTRGDNWKIKIYHNDPEQALKSANKLFSECQQKYGGSTDESD